MYLMYLVDESDYYGPMCLPMSLYILSIMCKSRFDVSSVSVPMAYVAKLSHTSVTECGVTVKI